MKTFGHLHPGGLHDTFSVTRDGQSTKVFTSKAKYYEPAGAVSWDVSMTATPDDWAVAVKAGDQLSISTTYDTSRASWYESMGLGVVWMYDGPGGTDPFTGTVDQKGVLTHGHLPENDNHGGVATKLADPRRTAAGPLTTGIPIGSFEYGAGDLTAEGKIPTVTAGQSITFDNFDARDQAVWHSITACKAPCTASTGVAYPLADATVQFDSGQLGDAGAPTVGREHVEHADRPRPGDLHLLLSRAPVHAWRVPGAAAGVVELISRRRSPGPPRPARTTPLHRDPSPRPATGRSAACSSPSAARIRSSVARCSASDTLPTTMVPGGSAQRRIPATSKWPFSARAREYSSTQDHARPSITGLLHTREGGTERPRPLGIVDAVVEAGQPQQRRAPHVADRRVIGDVESLAQQAAAPEPGLRRRA